VGSCELPDASSSSADTTAEQDLPALVGTRGPSELREGVGGSEGPQSPPSMRAQGAVHHSLRWNSKRLTRGLADEEGREALGMPAARRAELGGRWWLGEVLPRQRCRTQGSA